MTRLSLAIAVTLLLLPAAHAPLRADDNRNRLPDAVSRIERETGGRVLSAERRTRGGQEVTRIKVYTPSDGRVRIRWEDAPRGADRIPGERGIRGSLLPQRSGAPSDGAMVQRSARPEQTPLPERPARRDDGTPAH